MRVNISGHHVIVSDPMREYVLSKLNRFERYSDQITKIDVTLIVEKMVQKAEASIHVAGADLFANAGHEDMYSAIDSLTDKCLDYEKQIENYRSILRNNLFVEDGEYLDQEPAIDVEFSISHES